MSFQPGAMLYTQGFGSRPENVEVPHIDTRAPASTDVLYPIGKTWVDKTNNAYYVLTSLSSSAGTTTANWIAASNTGGSGVFSSLTVTGASTLTGTTNINTSGSAVTTIGTGGTGAVNIGNATGNTAVTGSLTASTGLVATTGGVTATAGGVTATVGAITATNGNVVLGTAGNKLSIATGANASVGTSVAMTAGTVTVNTTAVTASSIIFLTANTPGGTQGELSAPTASIVAGTSFVINSSSNTDTSTVNWWIVN